MLFETWRLHVIQSSIHPSTHPLIHPLISPLFITIVTFDSPHVTPSLRLLVYVNVTFSYQHSTPGDQKWPAQRNTSQRLTPCEPLGLTSGENKRWRRMMMREEKNEQQWERGEEWRRGRRVVLYFWNAPVVNCFWMERQIIPAVTITHITLRCHQIMLIIMVPVTTWVTFLIWSWDMTFFFFKKKDSLSFL